MRAQTRDSAISLRWQASAGVTTSGLTWNGTGTAALKNMGLTTSKQANTSGSMESFCASEIIQTTRRRLGRRAAEEIFAELAQIIRTSGVKGVGLAIDLKAWRSIMKSSTAKKVFFYKDPYVFGHAALVVYVAGELTGNIRGRMVSFLLDYHCKGKLVLNQMGDLKKFNPECAPYIGSIGFNDDKTTAQLQAADLIAGVSKNYALNELGQMPGDKEANKKALVGILGRSVGVGVLDHAYLTKVAKASGLSKGRPSIYSTLQRHLFE
jgi:hypothetical protein